MPQAGYVAAYLCDKKPILAYPGMWICHEQTQDALYPLALRARAKITESDFGVMSAA